MSVTYEIRFKAVEAPDAITLMNIQGEQTVRPTLAALSRAGAVILSVERVSRNRLDPATLLMVDAHGAIVRDNGNVGEFRSVLTTDTGDSIRVNVYMRYTTAHRAAQVASRNANIHHRYDRESAYVIEKWVDGQWTDFPYKPS